MSRTSAPQRMSTKSHYRRTRFGEVVQDVNVVERNALTSGVSRVVGIDDIDPECLKLSRWSDVSDGTSFTKRFQAGQVLYPKRRVYQKKVAVPHFEGICSGDILVLAPREQSLSPRFLPFIVQSESFLQHAIRTSAGSLSPRTKFKELATFEFLLPPISEQSKIADLLWASETATDALEKAHRNTDQAIATVRETLLSRGIRPGRVRETEIGKLPESWSVLPLEQPMERIIDYRGRSPEKTSGGVPLITAANIKEGFIEREPQQFIAEAEFDSWMTRGIPAPGDVLFTTEAPLGNVAPVPSYKIALAQRVIALCPDRERMSPAFLKWLLLSSATGKRVRANATGTTVVGIKQSVLRKVLVPVPPITEQNQIVRILDDLDALKTAIARQIHSAKQLKRKLMAEFIEPPEE